MGYPFVPRRIIKIILNILTGFVAFSAIPSGWGLIKTNGLGMSADWLGGAFPSFLIPGLILMTIVGGSNLFAFIMTLKNWRFAMEANMTAGFGLLIWIFTEMYLIPLHHILQIVYFSIAILILILTFLLYERTQKI